MTTYTFTDQQSAALVARWNEHANDENQINSDQVHLMISDNFDADMENDGCALVEVGRFASKTGNPATFYIYEEDVTVDA
ncbi:MAG: hypothetical protein N4A61_04825 [Pelagimonas sp.]|jgi:hypothetical protein|nr:hypothetical protein [Pelagimonas sp.]